MIAPECPSSEPPQSAGRVAVPDKWICDLRADDAVGDAARHVLEARVRLVARALKRLGRSKAEAGADEAVHQLRVSTRRAQAAALSFEPWLRRARRKSLKKNLKRLRDAAGAVRMADVHRDLLVRTMIDDRGGDERTAVDAALLLLDGERGRAVRALCKAVARTPGKDLLADARKAVHPPREDYEADASGPMATTSEAAAVEPDEALDAGDCNVPLHAAGQAALSRLATELRDSSRSDLACRENLHQMRLRGKRLRYAIEIFGCAAEDAQREHLIDLAARLSDLQERLGAINDLHEVAERVARFAAQADEVIAQARTAAGNDAAPAPPHRLATALERVADGFESRCDEAADAFRTWWASDDSSALRHGISLLASPATAGVAAANAANETEGSGAAEPEVEIVVIEQREGHAHAEAVDAGAREHADAEGDA